MENVNIKKNIVFNLTYQILAIIIPVFLTPYLTRTLGSEGLGEYSYYYSWAYFFSVYSLLGINVYGNRSIAKVSNDKNKRTQIFWEIYILQFFAAIVGTIIYFFVFFVGNVFNFVGQIFIIYQLSSFFDINWFFFGIEKFKITITRNLILKTLTVLLVIVLVKNENDVYKYALIMATSTFIANLILFMQVKKFIFLPANLRDLNIKRHISSIFIFFIPTIAVSIYKTMDKIMLGTLTNNIQVGFYEASERFLAIPTAFISSISTVMLPRVSNMIENSQEVLSVEYLSKSIKIVIMLVSPICFGIIAVSDVLVPIFMGPGFEECISILSIIMLCCPFLGIGQVLKTQYLIPHNMEREFNISVICGAVLNFFLNIILIPRFGAIGASIGTVAAEATVCLYQYIIVSHKLSIKKYIIDGFPYVLLSILMCIVVKFFCNIKTELSYIILLTKICAGCVIYLIGMFLIKIQNAGDMSWKH